MVESTDTAQLTSSSASAWATRAVNTRSPVPSTAHFRSRLQMPRPLPYFSGRCTHWVPVRNLKAIASITSRWSRRRPSRFGVRSGSNGSIHAPCASVNGTPGPATD